jgi:drug/metabolite transporter (DMT)-like permease
MMHLLVFIFGFTGSLGKLISLDAGPLVFWRVAIGAVAVAAWMAAAGRFRRLPRGMWWKAVGVGTVAASHWLAFFAAIKLSTVSVALAVIATVPFFVGLIEPAVHRRPVDRRELALAGAVVVGLFLILQDAHAGQTPTGPRLVAGACVALLAALLGGTFSVFNSVLVRHADSANLTRVELFSAAAFTGLFVAVQSGGEVASAFAVPAEDVLWLVLLGVVATAFAFLMGIEVMRQLSPFTCAMAEVERLRAETPVIFVDVHGETTSEKTAMAYHLDGKVSAVVGTHTHVQTADERVLPGGTAFLCDAGMCGPLDSILGRRADAVVKKFLDALPSKFPIAGGPVQVCGALIEIDPSTGHAASISRFQKVLDV